MMNVDVRSWKFFSWSLCLNSVFCFDVVLCLNYWFNHALVEIKAVEKFCDWITWKRTFVTRIVNRDCRNCYSEVWKSNWNTCSWAFSQRKHTKIHVHSRCDGRSFLKSPVCTFLWCNKIEMPTVKWFTTLYWSFDCYPIQYVNRKVLLPWKFR